MELTIFLAQILSLIYLATGLGILADKNRFRTLYDEMLRDSPLMYFMGILALVVGFIIVSFHNVWVTDWPVIVTVTGWLSLIKGILLVVMPKVILRHARFWLPRLQGAGVLVLVLGLVLGYFGFLA